MTLTRPNFLQLKMLGLRLLGLLPTSLLKALPVGRLVNTDRVRSTVKRMFKNSADEILAELIQNSMRAGALHFVITTRDGGFTISDDGGGVAGVSGFQA